VTPDRGLSHQFFLQVDVPEQDAIHAAGTGARASALPESVLVIACQAAIMDALKEGYGVRAKVTILALNEVNDS